MDRNSKFPYKLHKRIYQRLRLKLAVFKSYLFDKLLNIDTSGNRHTVTQDNSLCKDMYSYDPAFYGRLEKMLLYLRLTRNDVFLDLGCGKGRVIFFVAQRRVKKVVGLELDQNLFITARNNLKSLRHRRSSIEILNVDAACFNPIETTVFFLFNPFGENTLKVVLKNIKKSLDINPRKIRIVYYAPQFRELVDSQDWLTYEGFIENSDCLVWHN